MRNKKSKQRASTGAKKSSDIRNWTLVKISEKVFVDTCNYLNWRQASGSLYGSFDPIYLRGEIDFHFKRHIADTGIFDR